MREDQGVWNVTNLIVGTDRRLLAVIVGCRASGLSDKYYLTSVRVHVLMRGSGGAVGSGTALKVRFPMTSLKFYTNLILQAALWPVVD